MSERLDAQAARLVCRVERKLFRKGKGLVVCELAEHWIDEAEAARAEVERLKEALAAEEEKARKFEHAIEAAMDVMQKTPLTPSAQAAFKLLCRANGSGWREV